MRRRRTNVYEGGPQAKTKNTLGQSTVEEMDAMPEEELRRVILTANQAMEDVVNDLEENQKYQEIKNQKNTLESGKREVDRRQKARIKYALYLLGEKGKAPAIDEDLSA